LGKSNITLKEKLTTIALGVCASLVTSIILTIFGGIYSRIFALIHQHEQTFQLFLLISLFSMGVILVIFAFFWLYKKSKNRMLQKTIPAILLFFGVMLVFNSLYISFFQPQQSKLTSPPDLIPEAPVEEVPRVLEVMPEESVKTNVSVPAEQNHFVPALSSSASPNSIALSFAGDTFAPRDRQTVTAGLREAMQTWKTSLDLDENLDSGPGYSFTVTIYLNQTPTFANTVLLQAEVMVAFARGGRVLCQTEPYFITEMSEDMTAYRIAEQLKNDQAFFNKVNEALK